MMSQIHFTIFRTKSSQNSTITHNTACPTLHNLLTPASHHHFQECPGAIHLSAWLLQDPHCPPCPLAVVVLLPKRTFKPASMKPWKLCESPCTTTTMIALEAWTMTTTLPSNRSRQPLATYQNFEGFCGLRNTSLLGAPQRQTLLLYKITGWLYGSTSTTTHYETTCMNTY